MSVRTPPLPGRGAVPPGAIAVVGAIAAALAGPVLGAALARFADHLPSTIAPLSRLIAGTTLYGIGLVVVGVTYLALIGRFDHLRWGGLDPRRSRLIVAGIAALVCAWVVAVTGLAALGIPFAGNSTTSMADRGLPASLLVVAALSPLVVAPAEELLYRGVVQASLYDVTSRPAAILLASVPFALAHLPTFHADTADPMAVAVSLIAVFCLSLVFGWLHAATDDLLVPVAVHGGYNAVVFGLLYLGGV
jgi:hypothetical protein